MQSERACQLLNGRGRWGGRRNPVLWRSGDVHSVLFDVAVRKLTDLYALAEHGVETLRAYLEYLEDVDRFHASSAKLPALLRELERAAGAYTASMADPRRYAMAKRFMTAAHDDGVDVTDNDAMQSWLDLFNARIIDERARFLGPLCEQQPELITAEFVNDGELIAAVAPGRSAEYRMMRAISARSCSCAHSPVALAPRRALAHDAASALTLHRLAALAQWCEPGRLVDRHGTPSSRDLTHLCASFYADADTSTGSKFRTLADIPGAEPLWRLAVEQDVIRPGRRQVIPGPRAQLAAKVVAGEADDEATLDLWLAAFRAAVVDDEVEEPLAARLDEVFSAVLSALYRVQGPIGLAEIEKALEGTVPEGVEDDEEFNLFVIAGIHTTIGLLARLNRCAAVSIHTDDATAEPGQDLSWLIDPARSSVELTPLGVYGVREYLLGIGCEAPLTGAN